MEGRTSIIVSYLLQKKKPHIMEIYLSDPNLISEIRYRHVNINKRVMR